MKRTLVPLLLAACAAAEEAVPAPAPTPPPVAPATVPARVALDAEAAVRRALEVSADGRAADFDLEAARRDAATLAAFGRPQVVASANAGVADGVSNPFRPPGVGRELYAAGGEVSQYLFGFGRWRAAREIARGSVDQAAAGRDAARRGLAFAARATVADVQFARALESIARARVAQRQRELDDAAARVAAGAAAELDRRQAAIALANAEGDRLAAMAQVERARLALAPLVGLPAAQVDVAGDLARPGDLAPLIAAAGGEGADERALRAETATRRAQAAAARAQQLPVVSAYAAGEYRGTEADDLEDGWSAGLRLNWTLIDGAEAHGRARAADAAGRAAALRLAGVREQRAAALAQLRVRAEDLAARIALKERVVALAAEAYEDARARYTAGVETLTRVDEANLRVFEARFDLAALVREEVLLAAEARRLAE